MTYRHVTSYNPRLRNFTPMLVTSAFGLYFAFYMLFGPHGYLALQRLDARQTEIKKEYDVLKVQRESLEADVKLMRPTSLDRDMADEQTRRILGYVAADEIVIDLKH
jgi:cell division protein FtsB